MSDNRVASTVVTGQFSDARPLAPKVLLSRALGRSELAIAYGRVARHCGGVHETTLNLARYLTDVIPGVMAHATLLAECVESGLVAWDADCADASDHQRLRAFLRGLLYPTPDVLNHVVRHDDPNKSVCWDPWQEPLLDWRRREVRHPVARRRERPHDSRFVEAPAADFRHTLLCRFLATNGILLSSFASDFDYLVCRYG